MIYGYCRISTKKQSIERQIRNIKKQYPDAHIVQEVFTGTKFQGRKELEKLVKQVVTGDTIVFDSVSRMSRNAQEGFQLYQELYKANINLVFLKEPHINTDVYKNTLHKQIAYTGDKVDLILNGINQYLMELAKEQIRIAFEQAQKEVDDLRQRTREGLVTAKLNGKKVGSTIGDVYTVKKAVEAKKVILAKSKDFNGSNTNEEVMKIAGISAKTFYKYKKELKAERG